MTDTPRTDDTDRPLLTGWQVVALVALVLACAFAFLLLLPAPERLSVLQDAGGVLAPYVAPVLAAVAAAIAARAARAAKHETAKQTPLIRTAVAQTNGALTRRDERIRELEAQLEAERSPSPAGEGPSSSTLPAGFADVMHGDYGPVTATTTTTLRS